MSFQTGLSGLNASAKNLDVIGHNIANANTTGMKASRVEFSELYSSALGAAGGSSAGIGVQVATVSQLFSQGNLKITGNQLDLSINGGGFFQVKSPDGGTLYTRNGEFKLDKEGFIVTNNGARLQGFETDETGRRISVVTQDLFLPTGSAIEPRSTGITASRPNSRGIEVVANLDARVDEVLLTVLNPDLTADPPQADALPIDAKQYGTALNVYDTQGKPIAIQLYFVKSAANTWTVYASNDNGRTVLNEAGEGNLVFGTDGKLDTTQTTLQPLFIAQEGLAAGIPSEELNIPISLTDINGTPTVTQFGSKFGVFDLKQDGYPPGELTSIDIGENGVILARYSNGISKAEGQLALGNFRNLQGLAPVNGGYWSETFASGPVVLGGPQEGRLGLIRQSSLEESNVDLTQELVAMIVAQRAYQANAQTIKTQDQVQQTLVNLR
jgi:flagellar hook protein FlgE